jgi:hypothetical protein
MEDDGSSSSGFYPSSFSCKSRALKMCQGCDLGSELNIVVDTNIKNEEEYAKKIRQARNIQ